MGSWRFWFVCFVVMWGRWGCIVWYLLLFGLCVVVLLGFVWVVWCGWSSVLVGGMYCWYLCCFGWSFWFVVVLDWVCGWWRCWRVVVVWVGGLCGLWWWWLVSWWCWGWLSWLWLLCVCVFVFWCRWLWYGLCFVCCVCGRLVGVSVLFIVFCLVLLCCCGWRLWICWCSRIWCC